MNIAVVSREKGTSRSGRTKSRSLTGFGNGGIRDLTSRFATVSRPRIKNAHIRIVHGNPTILTSLETTTGNMTPPKLEPDAATPTANALLWKNQVIMAEKAG